MGIPFTSSETYRADDLNSLMEMVMAEDNNVCYTPLSNLKELKLSSDGKFYGAGFSENGLRAFTNWTGGGAHAYKVACEVEDTELAANIMNAYLCKNNDRLKDKAQLVVNCNTNTIIGCVSNRYRDFSNTQFISRVLGTGRYNVVEGILKDTKLRVKLVEEESGWEVAKGDTIHNGMLLRNDVSGWGSLHTRLFCFRLKCTNGMMVSTKLLDCYIKHYGLEQRFNKKVEDLIELTKQQYEVLKERTRISVSIPFKPHVLVEEDAPLSWLPDWSNRIHLIPGHKYQPEARSERYTRTIEMVENAPRKYTGPVAMDAFGNNPKSIFHMASALSEYAHLQGDAELQEQIEEGAGQLVSWAAGNKEELLAA